MPDGRRQLLVAAAAAIASAAISDCLSLPSDLREAKSLFAFVHNDSWLLLLLLILWSQTAQHMGGRGGCCCCSYCGRKQYSTGGGGAVESGGGAAPRSPPCWQLCVCVLTSPRIIAGKGSHKANRKQGRILLCLMPLRILRKLFL